MDLCSGKEDFFIKKDNLIREYKEKGKKHLIQGELKKLKYKYNGLEPFLDRELCYLTENYRELYLHDMKICQEYASLNRETMANIILEKLLGKSLGEYKSFHTIHNYINFKDNIIRKGSISAYKDETVLIPLNMRDGCILARGKSNPLWNYSAPHGAGRTMSRTKAKEKINLVDYQETMKGIYTTSVNTGTIDEAPMAYKPAQEIIDNIQDTVEIIKIIKPIYNFKASR